MLKRLLLAVFFVLAPVGAHADDATTDPVPTDTPTDAPSPTPTPIPDPSAGLGPTTGGTTGGSTGDSLNLQPAGNNPLQSTGNDSNGLTAPNANTLQQQASSSEQLKVLSGELGGNRVDPNADSDSQLKWWVLLAVALGLLISALAWADPIRQRLRRLTRRRR
jgi:hypothetical protein